MSTSHDISRRSLVKAGAAATAVLGAPGLLLAQAKPVKIGLVHPVSGGLAYSGAQARLGALMAIEEINAAFQLASQTNLKGIVAYTEDPIVSVDVIGNTHSCIFDAQLTSVIDKMVKVVGWYDNEIGYSSRLIDLILYSNQLKG